MQSHVSSNSPNANSLSLEAEFERIVRRQHRSVQNSWLKEGAIALLNFLTGQQTLSIRCKTLANGKTQWIAYDPTTHSHHVFDSQQAVRVWLEQRYHR